VSWGTDEARARAQAARNERARAAGFANYAAQYRAENPDRAVRQGSRATGTNPRAKGTNPRRRAANPTAGAPADLARVNRETRRAYARLHARGGYWCTQCSDTGHVYVACGHDDHDAVAFPCPAPYCQMTTADADLILRPGGDT